MFSLFNALFLAEPLACIVEQPVTISRLIASSLSKTQPNSRNMECGILNSTRFSLMLCLTILVTVPSLLIAQAPDKMNYQSIVRDNGGTPITNQNVSFQVSILEDNINGTVVFSETHQVMTNQFGYASLLIGTGQVVQGSFSDISWGSFDHFMKTEVDVNGGTNYADMGTSQLVSVPYALYANEAKTSKDGKTHLSLYGDITDNEAVQKINLDVGPNTQMVQVYETTQLSTVTLDSVEELEYIRVNSNPSLTTLSFPNLKVLSAYYDEKTEIENNVQLSSLDLSSLEFVQGRLEIGGNALTSIDFSSLTFVRTLVINQSILSSLDLPNVVVCKAILVNSNPNLTTLNIPSIDFTECAGVRLKENALSSSTINDLLNRLVAANVTGINIQLEDQNPPAPPTGQGLVDKQTLIDNGNTVSTD